MTTTATITPGADLEALRSASFVFDIINTLLHSPTIAPGSATATATWSQSFGGMSFDSIVTFHGTSLDTANGVVTGMDFSLVKNGVTYQSEAATGFDTNSLHLLNAITASNNGDTSDLKAIFQGINWKVDASAGTADEVLVFQGTGGNDIVKLGHGADFIGLDGGDDSISLGAGKDIIRAGNDLHYSSAGLAKIDGGAGFDTLQLDYQQRAGEPDISHGLKIDMSNTIKLEGFSVQITNVEHVVGTLFTDTIIGTAKADVIEGGGGGDLLIGGGGADTLTGTQGIDDFFTYNKDTDSGPGNRSDIISGFEHGVDVIDLHKLKPGTDDHEFNFVGDHQLKKVGDLDVVFHNGAGTVNDYYLVQGNLDNDKAAEFQIRITDLTGDHLAFTKADFIL